MKITNILNRKNRIIFLLAGFVIALVLVGSTVSVIAAPVRLSQITYPVAELESCGSEQECKVYCSVASNFSKCITYAEKAGLEIEIPDDKKGVFAAMQKGESPGQCKDEASCRNYCEDIDHIEECVNFVEKFKLANSGELMEMRQMADVKKSGVAFPGNCKTKESCLKYCDNSANAVVCMEFAQKAGFIPKEDADAVNKILPYLKSGGKLPGGCTTKELCDAYCESDDHTNECIDFAVGAGFMNKEEAEIVKKVGGKGPGNCRSREACDNYCKDEAHTDECIEFAVKAGFISQEDAEMAKKFGIMSGGPGDCKSKAGCEAFCAVSENKETCSSWAKDHGMDVQSGASYSGPGGCQSPEECTAYCIDHQQECQNFAPPGGEGMQDRGAEECVKQGGSFDGTTCKFPEGQFPGIECENPPCESSEQPGEGQGGNQQPQGGDDGFSGPGGCKTPDECQAYCESNPQACQGSSPSGGGPGYQTKPNEDHGAEECLKQGGNLKDGQCYFNQRDNSIDHGSEECTKQGGNWTGSSCNFPPPPDNQDGIKPQSLLMDHRFLGAMLRYLLK